MSAATPVPRSAASRAMIAASVAGSLGLSIGTDVVLLGDPRGTPAQIVLAAVLFNGTVLLMSSVGSAIEWRRTGHAIGRLLLLAGPLYALLAASWLLGDQLAGTADPVIVDGLNWIGAVLSYPGMALIAAWIPLLFPAGALPGPRWRLPVLGASAIVVSGAIAWAFRPGRLVETVAWENPVGIDAWPTSLQILVDAMPLALVVLVIMAAAGLVVRYRRGDLVERLQIRWLAGAVTIVAIGFVMVPSEDSIRSDDGPLASTIVLYAGVMAMPIAIGIAILRYRLYEIDRIISRTVGWAVVTALLLAVFASLVIGLQAILADLTQGETLAVAASTLAAAALFQPVRRRVQHLVDRRFDRGRYDGDRAAAVFGERLRDRVDLAGVERDLHRVADETLRPASVSIWVRDVTTRRTPAKP